MRLCLYIDTIHQHELAASPDSPHIYLYVFCGTVATQVLLRVHHHSLSSGQAIFKHRVSRRQRYTVVAAFDDEIDLGQHRPHLGETGGMMAEIVGAWQRVEGRKDGARYEGTHAG